MADTRSLNRGDIDKILAEAKVQELPAAAQQGVGIELIPDFCAIYRTKVRPILIIVIAFLKVINKAWADALAAIVAFADKACPV
jgi:hypothetical protein